MNDTVALQRQIDELKRIVDALTAQQEPNQDLSTGSSPVFANIYSGTYTPTLTSVANVDGSTAYLCQYKRVGNVVTVSGRVDIDPTLAASTATRLGVSLPIASSFANSHECGGAGYATGVVSLGFAVVADATNDRAQITFLSTITTNNAFHFSFAYLVI